MRSRRRFISGVVGGTTLFAGCSEQLSDESSSNPNGNGDSEQSQDSSIESQSLPPSPSFEWDESVVNGRQYQITLKVDFDGADRVSIKADQTSVMEIRPNKSGQTVTVAGPNTSYGTAEPPTLFHADYRYDETERTGSTHIVGSIEEPEPTPIHLDNIIGGTGEDLLQGSYAEREYVYEINRSRWRYTSHVPRNLVDHYERRHRIDEYGAYVSDPLHEQYIGDMADAFIEAAESERQAIEHARAFVQQLEYTKDRVSQGVNDYPQFPVETMFASQGDCEDTSILLSAIYQEMGYGTVLLALWDEQHMALGIKGDESIPGTYYEHKGNRYYYVETTASGWEIGQMPNDLTQTRAEIFDVHSHPSLLFSWSTSARPGGVDARVTVNNRAEASASNVRITGKFEDQFERVVARDSAQMGWIGPNDIQDTTLELEPPVDRKVRGRFSVFTDGTLYDEATTNWIDPI